jgi:hypothetical protein
VPLQRPIALLAPVAARAAASNRSMKPPSEEIQVVSRHSST